MGGEEGNSMVIFIRYRQFVINIGVVVKLVILVVLGMLFFVRGLFSGGVPVLSVPLILLIMIDA